MADLNVHDIQQLFGQTVCLYKDKPVYVKKVAGKEHVQILFLLTQKVEVVPFVFDNFEAPARRLGMMNIDNSVLYAQRNPVRQMTVGLNSRNVQFHMVGEHYPEGGLATTTRAAQMTSVELAECMFGIYPSFEDATDWSAAFEGTVAFDRQFAIDCTRSIYYKTRRVASLPRGKAPVIENIKWDDEYSYLKLVVGKDYEKTFRA